MTTGTKGRLTASEREFEIVACAGTTSTIRFRFERQAHEIDDADLRPAAVTLEKFAE